MSHPSSPSPAPYSRGPGAGTRLLAVLLLLVAGALGYTVWQGRHRSEPPPPPAEPRAVTPRGDLADDEKSTIDLFRNDSPSVVHVTSLEIQRSQLSLNVYEIPQGTGSGFIWDADGHVVTNYHVIKDGSGAEVILSDNSVWKAQLVGVARDKDLAVLKIDAPRDKLKAIAVGTSSNLLVGQKVFAIGNPFGLDQTLTTGVISGLDREIQSVTKRPIQGVIQTDAAINPGNSGGPLLDSAGRLIGINTAIYSTSGAYAGIGFAVPVDTINSIVPQLITHGKVMRPGLGITILPDSVGRQLRLEGVLVAEVPADSAAARAGLNGTVRGSDGRWILGDVIVAVDDQPTHDSNELYLVLDHHKVGESVSLSVVRGGVKRNVDVTLQDLPQ